MQWQGMRCWTNLGVGGGLTNVRERRCGQKGRGLHIKSRQRVRLAAVLRGVTTAVTFNFILAASTYLPSVHAQQGVWETLHLHSSRSLLYPTVPCPCRAGRASPVSPRSEHWPSGSTNALVPQASPSMAYCMIPFRSGPTELISSKPTPRSAARGGACSCGQEMAGNMRQQHLG